VFAGTDTDTLARTLAHTAGTDLLMELLMPASLAMLAMLDSLLAMLDSLRK